MDTATSAQSDEATDADTGTNPGTNPGEGSSGGGGGGGRGPAPVGAAEALARARRLFVDGEDAGVLALVDGHLDRAEADAPPDATPDATPDGHRASTLSARQRGDLLRLGGLAALRQGDIAMARRRLEAARADLGGEDVALSVALGGACLADGAVGTAEVHFRRALALAPQAIGAAIGLANALERQNDRAGALETWRQAAAALIALTPDSADPWMLGLPLEAGAAPVLGLARRLRGLGDVAAGDRLARRLKILFPTNETVAAEADGAKAGGEAGTGETAPTLADAPARSPDADHGILYESGSDGPRLLMDQAAEADRAGHPDRARSLYRRAGSLAVGAPSPLDDELAALALGAADALRRMGDATTAAGLLERLSEHRPDDSEVARQQVLALFAAGRAPAALDLMESARARLGDGATLALVLLHASLLRRADRIADAIRVCREAVARWPDHADAHRLLAQTLSHAGRDAEALSAAFAALLRDPSLTWCHGMIARILEGRNQLDPALEHHARVVEFEPDSPDAHVALGLALLKRGDWVQGWEQYEWRVLKTDRPADSFIQAPWEGEPLDGKRLLIWHERQGLVEELMFLRLAQAAARVSGSPLLIEADARLVPLLRRGLPDHDVVAQSDPPDPATRAPEVAAQTPFGSLARLISPDPAAGVTPSPTLAADEARAGALRAGWLAQAGAGAPETLLVGVCWSPLNAARRPDRVAPLDTWGPVFEVTGLRFVSVQVGPAEADLDGLADRAGAAAVARAGDDRAPSAPGTHQEVNQDFNDLEALAARIAAVDVVVTVDAMPAHLAGALGVPALVLLPFAADWRWGDSGQRSPWYPSLRLARQSLPGDWSRPMARVAQALARYRDAARSTVGAA